MTISIPKEIQPGETRAAIVPEHVAKLVKLGARVEVEAGLGMQSGRLDEAYVAAGFGLKGIKTPAPPPNIVSPGGSGVVGNTLPIVCAV